MRSPCLFDDRCAARGPAGCGLGSESCGVKIPSAFWGRCRAWREQAETLERNSQRGAAPTRDDVHLCPPSLEGIRISGLEGPLGTDPGAHTPPCGGRTRSPEGAVRSGAWSPGPRPPCHWPGPWTDVGHVRGDSPSHIPFPVSRGLLPEAMFPLKVPAGLRKQAREGGSPRFLGRCSTVSRAFGGLPGDRPWQPIPTAPPTPP